MKLDFQVSQEKDDFILAVEQRDVVGPTTDGKNKLPCTGSHDSILHNQSDGDDRNVSGISSVESREIDNVGHS